MNKTTKDSVFSALRRLLCAHGIALSTVSCASAPWVCTPDTCVSVATQELPEEVAGVWRAPDGSILQMAFFTAGPNGPVVRTTATVVGGPAGDLGLNHVTSFDGRILVAEERVSEGRRSARRFHRIWVEDDRLGFASLKLDVLLSAANSEDVKLVKANGGEAVVYTDLRAMAATMVGLLNEPRAWDPETVYARVPI